MSFTYTCSKCGAKHTSDNMRLPNTITTISGKGYAFVCKAHLEEAPKAKKEKQEENSNKRWEKDINELQAMDTRNKKLHAWLDVMGEARKAEKNLGLRWVAGECIHVSVLCVKHDQMQRDITNLNAWTDVRVKALEEYRYAQEYKMRREMAELRHKIGEE